MQRNVAFLVLQFILPSFQVALFCLAIGKDPKDLTVSFVNADTGLNISVPCKGNGTYFQIETLSSPQVICPNNYSGQCCPGKLAFGDLFLEQLKQGSSFNLKGFTASADAIDEVHSGNAWGAISIPLNFSVDLALRFLTETPSSAVIDGSTIVVNLDESNEQIAIFVRTDIQAAFQNLLLSDLSNPCCPILEGLKAKAQNPVKIGTPVYGFDNPSFTDFIAPGMIITIAFAQAIGLTSAVFTQDKATGNMDRQWAAGLRPSELLIAQTISQFIILLMQVGCLLFVALVIFSLPMVGSIVIVLCLAMELGMAGMMYGLTIAANANTEQEATQLALGSFFPVLLLSGVIWPREGMPPVLLYISYALPTTWAADAMRSIMTRGWGLSYPVVWQGFVVVAAWIAFLFIFAVRGLKKNSNT